MKNGALGGTKTYLGLHSRGSPNLFIVSGPQGGGGQFNFIRVIDAHTDYVTWMMKTMHEKGADIVDVDEELEEACAAHCREADLHPRLLRDCISYYNDKGMLSRAAWPIMAGRRNGMSSAMPRKNLSTPSFSSLRLWMTRTTDP